MSKKLNAKKHMQNLLDNGVKIKCVYCDLKETCKTRVNKEKSESMGIVTYCTLTPNKPKRKKVR